MTLPRTFPALLLPLLLLSMPAWPARAQIESREAISLQDQIAELRQEIQVMQQNQQAGGGQFGNLPPPQPEQPQPQTQQLQPGAGGDTLAELVVRVSTLEEQNRQLQGRVDDLANQLQKQNDALSKQIGDLAFKLGQGAPGQGAPAGDAQPDSLTPPPSSGGDEPGSPPAEPNAVLPQHVVPPVHRTPEIALREANAAMARRDYADAAALAREALQSHGPRSTDAQFVLARAEGGLRQYRQAAADFYLAYSHAPKSATAPVALLGVANALIALNDNKDACEALAKLSVEFPHVPEGVRANVGSARKRAACSR
jgi:TolA-binding protein